MKNGIRICAFLFIVIFQVYVNAFSNQDDTGFEMYLRDDFEPRYLSNLQPGIVYTVTHNITMILQLLDNIRNI